MTPCEWDNASWKELLEHCSKAQEYLLNSILDLKYEVERNRNHSLIRSLSARLKTMDSLTSKLKRMNLEPSVVNAATILHDIAGIRIICSYLDDINTVISQLEHIPHYEILEVKDYVHNPKPSGYRSVHVIGLCDISGRPVRCEIQLRTTAMDSWAALEHQMRYKKDLPDCDFVNHELFECARMLYETDCRMQVIHGYLHNQALDLANGASPKCSDKYIPEKRDSNDQPYPWNDDQPDTAVYPAKDREA